MFVKILEIIIGLIIIFTMPTILLIWLARYQDKKGYNKDYDKRYAYYMRERRLKYEKEKVEV